MNAINYYIFIKFSDKKYYVIWFMPTNSSGFTVRHIFRLRGYLILSKKLVSTEPVPVPNVTALKSQ